MSERYNKAFDFLNGVEFVDQRPLFEEEFILHIDECVAYGSYTVEEGEAYKEAYKDMLWAA
jgi:hypothetical protein